MNKGIVALLIVLALLVLVSPGIVGMLAERSVDEQIEWVELENQDIVITAERFDRGWFSSQGRHRIELRDSGSADGIKLMLEPVFGNTVPALIVDTKLTHGPIAMTGAGGESGSLSPGLGKAVSTLSFETDDGEVFMVPGTVYSSIAMTGDLASNYIAAAGSGDLGTWGDVNISFDSMASSGAYAYDGQIDSVHLADTGTGLSNLAFSGDLAMSEFGLAVGDMALTLDHVSFDSGGNAPFSIGPLALEANTSINEGRLESVSELNMIVGDLPGLGHIGLDTRFTLGNLDGVALQALVNRIRRMQSNGDATALMAAIEKESLDLLAAGADLHIERLDIALPQGTIKSVMNFKINETDNSDLLWTSVLLALEADAKLEIPAAIADMAMMMSPQAGAVESFLIKNGDIYELEAAYKKGLLTVNGVPMALPIQ